MTIAIDGIAASGNADTDLLDTTHLDIEQSFAAALVLVGPKIEATGR